MFTVDEYLASIKTNLAQHTDVLVNNLKTIAEATFAPDVELLDFSAFIEPSRHDLSIMFFSMDREANEVFEEAGTPGFAGSESMLDEAVYYHVTSKSSDDFDVFHEEHEEILIEQERQLFTEWFSTCWQQAGGEQVQLPAYFNVHDEGETFDLKRQIWMDEEEKWD
ncbi:hypothetical protein [Exiguobacterium undae]|uniref:DUF4303 domain-containing protein n=1 Tax=Exiguobacterium undae TaxID=169177 RepID=A0ABX2VCL4_9BACL|nr:hypothetical protein [Exiguobacterium undae]OAN15509.1 hypothetical protein A3783_06125 [Exiguobacterium undae]